MAEKRRGKSKKREDEVGTPTKEEYAVAKFLRFNVPTKEGKLVGMTVRYFIASKAVDALMDSKWAKGKEPLFTNRSSVADYCNTLLRKGMFHRAARSERKRGEKKKPKKIEAEDVAKEEEKKKKSKKSKEKDEPEEKKETKSEGKAEKDQDEKADEKEKEPEKKEEEKKDEEKKKKKKARLEMHDTQIFKDGDEVYVWIYDPVPLKTFIIGLLLVLGAVAVCLFPLWPPEVRLGVYYLSLAAAGFVGLILALCVVRLILFCIVWVLTFGNHHFWFLPNLTEDVGFFDSFKPLYKHDICKDEDKGDKDQEDKDKKDEEEKESKEEEAAMADVGGGGDVPDEEEREEELANEDSGKEQSEKGSGSENDNGYEIVQREEIEEQQQEEQEEQSGDEGEPVSPSDKKNQ